MDWSLALASQGIACIIRSPVDGLGWALELDAQDAGPALRTLRAYHIENRRRSSALPPAVGELLFHWGVLAWCMLLAVFFMAAETPDGRVEDRGVFDTAFVACGGRWAPLSAPLSSAP